MEFHKNRHLNNLGLVVIGAITSVALVLACEHAASAEDKSYIDKHAPSSAQNPAENLPIEPSTTDKLEDAWARELVNYKGEIDIAAYDYQSGQTAHFSNVVGKKFIMASTIKLSILENLLLQNQQVGSLISDQQRAEAVPMITWSDNASASSLWEELGGSSAMQDFFIKIGTTHTSANTEGYWGLSLTTALDQLSVAKQLAHDSSLLSPQSIDIARSILDDVIPEQRWGVPANIQTDIRSWAKNGWLNDASTDNDFSSGPTWTINSVGYVEGSINGNVVRYALAEYSSGNETIDSGQKVLTKLANIAWNMLSRNQPSE